MRDDPSGADLIEAARRALAEEVVPGLTGRPRYVALMVANALGIAAREIGRGMGSPPPRPTSLPGREPMRSSVRSGRGDGTPTPRSTRRLSAKADVASRIWKPRPPVK